MATDLGFPGYLNGKESTGQCRSHRRCRFNPWVGKISWRRKWHPTQVFLPGQSPPARGGWQAAVHGVAESDMTEHTHDDN